MRKVLDSTNAIQRTPAETARPPWRHRAVLLFLVGWTFIAVLALGWLLNGHAGTSVWIVSGAETLRPAVGQRFHAWFKSDMSIQRVYPWVLLGPYVALVASYFPLERGRLRLSLPINLAACVAFIAASEVIMTRLGLTGAHVVVLNPSPKTLAAPGGRETNAASPGITAHGIGNIVPELMTNGDAILTSQIAQLRPGFHFPPMPPGPPRWAQLSALLDLLAYGAIVGLAHSVHFYRRFRERERRALVLESNLANARLHALRAQLQPHFLFNSLNAVAALLRRDPRLAETTLLSLSELLRLSLSQSETQEIALRDELKLVQRYLEIQQTRFGDKLRVEQEVEPAALDCRVPTLLLQPLVENALRHGIEPSESAGLVRLTARRREGKLALTVEDDGVGLAFAGNGGRSLNPREASTSELCDMGSRGGTGIGLANLRARLETLYGAHQKLELTSRPEGGVVVRVEIPCRPAAPPEASDPRSQP